MGEARTAKIEGCEVTVERLSPAVVSVDKTHPEYGRQIRDHEIKYKISGPGALRLYDLCKKYDLPLRYPYPEPNTYELSYPVSGGAPQKVQRLFDALRQASWSPEEREAVVVYNAKIAAERQVEAKAERSRPIKLWTEPKPVVPGAGKLVPR